MFSDIEQKTLDRLEAKGLPVQGLKREKGSGGIVTPRVNVALDEGTFKLVGQVSYKVDTTLYLDVTFKNFQTEDARRKGIWPVLLSALNILNGQTLGLKIDPLTPLRIQNVTNLADLQAGEIVFQIQFKTGFSMEKVDDEAAERLLKIGMDFYLQEPAPPDATPDTSSVVGL